MGVTLIDQEPASDQNYAMKLQTRLKYAYQKARRIIKGNLNVIKNIMIKG